MILQGKQYLDLAEIKNVTAKQFAIEREGCSNKAT